MLMCLSWDALSKVCRRRYGVHEAALVAALAQWDTWRSRMSALYETFREALAGWRDPQVVTQVLREPVFVVFVVVHAHQALWAFGCLLLPVHARSLTALCGCCWLRMAGTLAFLSADTRVAKGVAERFLPFLVRALELRAKNAATTVLTDSGLDAVLVCLRNIAVAGEFVCSWICRRGSDDDFMTLENYAVSSSVVAEMILKEKLVPFLVANVVHVGTWHGFPLQARFASLLARCCAEGSGQ